MGSTPTLFRHRSFLCSHATREKQVAGWYGVIAPLKTPQPIVDRLNKEIVDILHQPDVASRLAADGSEPVGSTAQQFSQHIKSEVANGASWSSK